VDPATEALIVAAIEALAQLTQEGIALVDDWIHAKGDEAQQVALARIAASVSVDAYQKIRDAVGK
jgi:hypothetical protein